jgi:hypothetical protein
MSNLWTAIEKTGGDQAIEEQGRVTDRTTDRPARTGVTR